MRGLSLPSACGILMVVGDTWQPNDLASHIVHTDCFPDTVVNEQERLIEHAELNAH